MSEFPPHARPRSPLPFEVDLAAFRIVQEALTNVTRHAHDAQARVHITYGDGDLIVEIDDHGPGVPAAGTPGAGKGIRGMRERAQALGGEPEAGPKDGGASGCSPGCPGTA